MFKKPTSLSKRDKKYFKSLAASLQNLKEKRSQGNSSNLQERIKIEEITKALSKTLKTTDRATGICAMTWIISNMLRFSNVEIDDLQELYIEKIQEMTNNDEANDVVLED